ncbi:hypothetical protein AAFF_G00227500 [Aldrovandia affinis]|uniref:CENP-T/Histone H4 histone fold domain-containing protein n=1 Tax=Aldrovandia affinis TaxID=143900 RepID=A0AAD7TC39_9TELE|nr:hypothetical protein AAFF_G00227500 [Aldrovandia affinis]
MVLRIRLAYENTTLKKSTIEKPSRNACCTMDPFDEDVSARVLLRNFLHSEQPSSAVTRSESQRTSSELRRSHRLRKSDAGLLSPRGALRKKLGQNLKEKIFIRSPIQRGTRSSLTLSRNVNTPAVALHSPVEDDLTPRGLLRGILQTEPELSLLVPDRPVSVEHGSASSESSLCSNRPSMGMSNLDLPDLPTMNLTAAIRGISRKRPKRNVNMSVFEREMTDLSEDDAGDKERDATGNLSGASASSLTLSLKTPLVDLRTDGRFLQRKVGKRKAISVEAFEQGIDDLPARKRDRAREQSLENITSGLNDTTAYDLDKSSTVLYSQPVSMATMPHATAFVSMHDRDTVTATQIQREVEGGRVQAADEMEDGEMEEAAEDFDDIDAGVENAEEEAVESVKETEESESEENMEGDELEEEEEAAVESETQEEEVTSGEQVRVVERVSRRAHRSEGVKKIPGMAAGGRGYKSLSHGLQLVDTESKGSAGRAEPGEQEDDAAAESEREERQSVKKIPGMAAGGRGYKSLSHGLQLVDTESKGSAGRAEPGEQEDDAAAESEREERQSASFESDREEEELGMQEGGATESETQEEEVTSGEQVRVAERVSRRAHRSEGVKKIPGMAAGGRGYKSLSHGLQLVDTESKGSAGWAEPGEQEDDAAAEFEREEKQSASSESDREEEELGMQEGGATESETQEGKEIEGDETEEEEEAAAESETQEEEVTSGEQVQVVERVSRRAHRSEGVMKIPGMAAGGRGYKSLSHGLQLVDTESKGSAGRAEPGEQEDDAAAESEREERQSASFESDREEEELGMQEGGATESETQEGEEIEGDETEEEEEAAAESETQEEEVTSGEQVRVVERVSRRAHRSEGVKKIPGMAAGGRGYKSLSHGLQLVDTEGGLGWAEPGPSEGAASRVWHSGTEGGSRPMGVSPSRSSRPPSPVSPNEIPPSPESLRSSAGRGLRQVEEHMGGGDHAEEAEDKENSIPLPHLVSPEMSSPPPQTLHTFTGAGPSTGVRSEGEQSEEEEADDDEEEDDGADSDELSLKTPAFVRQKRRVQTPGHAATPNFLKQIMEARAFLRPQEGPQAGPAAKPKHQRKPQAAPSQEKPGLPKSFIMSTFKHFAKTKVSPVVYPVLKDIMDKYFNRLADDLEAYATHAKRKTIEVQDVELLMRRQGFVTDSMPVNVLIEKYLPHEYRKLLIPMATSGNKVVPKQR